MKRIGEKISEIRMYVDDFAEIMPGDFHLYRANKEKKAACERYVEKIVEAMTDLAFLAVKSKKFRMPEDDTDAFTILLENSIIDENLTAKLKAAKGMRNIIAHQYGVVDDKVVIESLEELEKDAKEFVAVMDKKMK